MTKKIKVRIPQQDRSKETKQAILNAGLALFSEKGFYRTNSKEIARKAGVSTGSFYLYYNDKKELFKELLTEYHRKVHSVLENIDIGNLLKTGGKKEFLRYFINVLVKSHDINPKFHREIQTMAQTDIEFAQIIEDSKEESIKFTKSALSIWKKQLRIKNIDAAAVVVQIATEEIVNVSLFILDNESGKRVIDELIDMLFRYLFEE